MLLVGAAGIPGASPASAGPALTGQALMAPSLPGVVLVGFHAGVSDAEVNRVLAAVGGEQVRVVGQGAHVVRVAPSRVASVLAALRKR